MVSKSYSKYLAQSQVAFKHENFAQLKSWKPILVELVGNLEFEISDFKLR